MTQIRTVTIFGGTGFIGRYLIDRLADQGIVIRVATRRPSSMYFLRTAGMVGQVVAVQCNIHNDASVVSAISGSDAVINLIGVLNEKDKTNNFNQIHSAFPTRLARLSAQYNVKHIVHVSALGASENAPSDYSRSKALGERGLHAEFPTATILRPSIIFGPEDGFFNLFAKMSTLSPFLPLIGGGKTLFQPVYVGDVVKAIQIAMIPTAQVQGKIFELGGAEKISFKECLIKMMSYTGIKKPLITIPFWLAKIQGTVLQRLPGKLLTLDQVKSLTVDNCVSGNLPTLEDLNSVPTPMDIILPTYLSRYRVGGRFATRHQNKAGL